MPFSLATGLTEAALAVETDAAGQRQASRTQARVSAPKAEANRADRMFETRKDMKIFFSRRRRNLDTFLESGADVQAPDHGLCRASQPFYRP